MDKRHHAVGNPRRKARHIFRNFQNKYLFTLLLVSLIPLLVTLFIVLDISRTHFESQQQRSTMDEMLRISQNLNARIEQLKLARDNLTSYALSQFSTVSANTAVQSYAELAQYESMRSNVTGMETLYNVARIRIFSDRFPYLQESNHLNFFNMKAFYQLSEQYPKLLEGMSLNQMNYILLTESSIFLQRSYITDMDMVTFYRSVYNTNHELIAVLLLECSTESFLQYLNCPENTIISVSNAEGEIICTNTTNAEAVALTDIAVQDLSCSLHDQRLIARFDVPLVDWKLTISSPFTVDINVWEALGSIYLCIIAATFLLAVGAGVLVSHLQARRLQRYYNAVRAIDYSVPQSITGLPDELDHMLSKLRNPDEVDELMGSFSTLIRDNLNLIDDRKQHELEIEKYKFKVLQEQINPHFLYNALETLRLCMIMDRKNDALRSLDALCKFYRIALSKGRDTISVREELDMICNYLEIENIGYNGAIRREMDVDEDCLDMPIPKFLLQPLVENSILHSNQMDSGKPLVVSICIHNRNRMLEMIVRDNGAGIDAEKLSVLQDTLANGEPQRSKSGFGLCNVNCRIKLFYGSQYGLEIRSIPGCTENIILLPIDILW